MFANVPRNTGFTANSLLLRAQATSRNPKAPLARHGAALAAQGQDGDKHLVHVNDDELAEIRRLFGHQGTGTGKPNPVTGLESFSPNFSPSSYQPDALGFSPSNYNPVAQVLNDPGIAAARAQAADAESNAQTMGTVGAVIKDVGTPLVKGVLGNGNSSSTTGALGDIGGSVKNYLFGVGDGTTVAPTVGSVAPEFAISPEAADISNAAGSGALGSSSDVLGTGASLGDLGNIGGGIGGLTSIYGGVTGLMNADRQNGVGIAGDVAQLGGGLLAGGAALGGLGIGALAPLAGLGPVGLGVAAVGALASSLFGNKHPQHPTGQATATVDAAGNQVGDFNDYTTDHGNAAGSEDFVSKQLLPDLQKWAKDNGYNLNGDKFSYLNNAGTPGLTFQAAGPHGTILDSYDPNDPNGYKTTLGQIEQSVAAGQANMSMVPKGTSSDTIAAAGKNYFSANPDVADYYAKNSDWLNMTPEQYALYHYETDGQKQGRNYDIALTAPSSGGNGAGSAAAAQTASKANIVTPDQIRALYGGAPASAAAAPPAAKTAAPAAISAADIQKLFNR